MKKILNFIAKTTYVLFFVGVITVILLLFATRLPIPGNFQALIVQSGSMEPAIKTGSVVVVKPDSGYQLGDVITFRGSRGQVPITHRVVAIDNSSEGQLISTQGDANSTPDPQKLQPEQIEGKVWFSLPYVGYAVAAAKEPIGFALIIIVPALMIIWEEVGKIRRELKLRRHSVAKEKA